MSVKSFCSVHRKIVLSAAMFCAWFVSRVTFWIPLNRHRTSPRECFQKKINNVCFMNSTPMISLYFDIRRLLRYSELFHRISSFIKVWVVFVLIHEKVWSSKIKATRTFMNIVIWWKSISRCRYTKSTYLCYVKVNVQAPLNISHLMYGSKRLPFFFGRNPTNNKIMR